MADGQLRAVIGQLRRLIGGQGGSTLSDAQLLEAFVTRRDEAAFEVLVWRHGTMVYNLCQRILRDAHQAEDAFQATFLVFVRKAGSIGKREALGSWLYKVAFRIACRARARSVKNTPAALLDGLVPPDRAATNDDVIWRDLKPVLDEEINRLPEKFRAPLVLCHLQGHTNEEAAQMLGCPKGTILSRLARGREKLRARLVRRGVALSAGWLAAQLSSAAASAAVPAGLISTTVKASIPFAAGGTAGSLVSASVAQLTDAALHAMFVAKVKLAVCAVVVLAVLGTGAGSFVCWGLTSSEVSPGGTFVLQAAADAAPAAEPPSPQKLPKDEAAGGVAVPDEERIQTCSGRVVSVPADGSGIVLETPAGRDSPARQVVVTFGPKTSFTYNGVGLSGARPKEGYSATVQMLRNEAVSVVFQGEESARSGRELTGRVADIAADGKSLTLEEAAPGRERSEPAPRAKERPENPRRTPLQLNERTQLIFSGVAAGGAQPAAGQRVQVWLSDDPAGNVVARAQFLGPEPIGRRDLAPDVIGRVVSLSGDGKTLILAPQGDQRGGNRETAASRPADVEIRLDASTSIVFQNVLAGQAKIVPGQQAAIWLAAGSKDRAAQLSVSGTVSERWETLMGEIVAISADGNRLTLAVHTPSGRDGARNEPRSGNVKNMDVVLSPRTRLSFHGVGSDEARLTLGYIATVRLADGSSDVASHIALAKPGAAPPRGR